MIHDLFFSRYPRQIYWTDRPIPAIHQLFVQVAHIIFDDLVEPLHLDVDFFRHAHDVLSRETGRGRLYDAQSWDAVCGEFLTETYDLHRQSRQPTEWTVPRSLGRRHAEGLLHSCAQSARPWRRLPTFASFDVASNGMGDRNHDGMDQEFGPPFLTKSHRGDQREKLARLRQRHRVRPVPRLLRVLHAIPRRSDRENACQTDRSRCSEITTATKSITARTGGVLRRSR